MGSLLFLPHHAPIHLPWFNITPSCYYSEMTNRRSREDLAWVAGFWDGEGHTGTLNTTTTRGHPHFCISQAGDEASALLHRVLNILQVQGAVNGPYSFKNNPTWTPQHQLRISGFERVQAILAMCWPWLSVTKRQQAIKVLRTYHETHPPCKARTHCAKCGSEWVPPNIVYNPASRGWRCRVCRRKNPAASRPNGQYRRKHFDADARKAPTHDPVRILWD